MKVNFEIRIRNYCPGCGVTRNFRMFYGPYDEDESPNYLAEQIRHAMEELKNLACPTCQRTLKTLDWFSEPPARKKRKIRRKKKK